jgi:hypothetical protein
MRNIKKSLDYIRAVYYNQSVIRDIIALLQSCTGCVILAFFAGTEERKDSGPGGEGEHS